MQERGTVYHACRDAKISRQAAYRWRKDDDEFREAWEHAVEDCTDQLEESMYQRAMDGDTTAGIFLLKGMRPDKFRERKNEDSRLNINVDQHQVVPVVSRAQISEADIQAALVELRKAGIDLNSIIDAKAGLSQKVVDGHAVPALADSMGQPPRLQSVKEIEHKQVSHHRDVGNPGRPAGVGLEHNAPDVYNPPWRN